MLKSHFSEEKMEAGCDEAGRGCLAGPVVAATVIWPRGLTHATLNDSKQLSKSKREFLYQEILEIAEDYAISEVSPQEIDRINILNASYLAMNQAVSQLKVKPELLLIDGNRFSGNPQGIPHECIIKGDGKFLSIAAASILAKVHRDKVMSNLGQVYPVYKWQKNAGYPTPEHKQIIEQHGITEHHRKTFLSKMKQLKLF